MPALIHCLKCGQDKPEADFRHRSDRPELRTQTCEACRNFAISEALLRRQRETRLWVGETNDSGPGSVAFYRALLRRRAGRDAKVSA